MPPAAFAWVQICMGRESKDGGNAGEVCDGKFRTQQQGGSSGVCETSVDEIAVVGGIRAEGGMMKIG